MTVFMDTAQNFHPYECDGPGGCVHCDRKKTDTHSPEGCALCACPICGGQGIVAVAGPDENGMYDTEDCRCQLEPA